MSDRSDPTADPLEPEHWTEAAARTQVGTALAVLELAATVLAKVPSPDEALRYENRELFRLYSAAQAVRGWLVGQTAEASVEEPERDSVLGDGRRIYHWSPEELERHYRAALADFRDEPPPPAPEPTIEAAFRAVAAELRRIELHLRAIAARDWPDAENAEELVSKAEDRANRVERLAAALDAGYEVDEQDEEAG